MEEGEGAHGVRMEHWVLIMVMGEDRLGLCLGSWGCSEESQEEGLVSFLRTLRAVRRSPGALRRISTGSPEYSGGPGLFQ